MSVISSTRALGAAQHGGVLAGARGGVGIGQRDALHAELAGLLEQRLPAGRGSQPDHLELELRSTTSSAWVPSSPWTRR